MKEQAFILLSVLVDTDGRAKDPLVEEALAGESRSDFENAAIDAILSAQFRPARRAGAAIATRRAMRIYFAVADRNLWNERALRELKRKADGGDVRSQATVAYMAMVTTGWMPAFNLTPDKRARAGVMAALNGSAQMQLWLSVELSRSAGSNDVGASHWRREAARHGSAGRSC